MPKLKDVTFIPPWRPLESGVERDGISRQLAQELTTSHRLWGEGCEVIGRSDTNDDILMVCENGCFAIVHLTWNEGPGDDEHPRTAIYDTTKKLNDALWRDAVGQGFVEDFDPNDPRLNSIA